MNLLQQFVDFLLNQRPKPSLLTVKNYKADVSQFINWLEKELGFPFNPSAVTFQILQKYKRVRSLSERSMERHASSLRKFFNFLKTEGIVFQNPLGKMIVSAEARALEDPWMIRGYKNFLYEYKKSNLTIKNYINDIKSFFTWLNETALVKYAWNIADKNLLDKINNSVVEEYKQRLIGASFSPRTINRKLSSLRSYIGWAKGQGLIPENSEPSQTWSEYSENQNVRLSDNQIVRSSGVPSFPSVPSYSSFPPKRLLQKSLKGINLLFDNLFILPLAQTLENAQYLFWKVTGKKIFYKGVIRKSPQAIQADGISNIKKEFYAPLSASIRYLPVYKRILYHIRHTRPNWYKKYHSYSFTHYFHFAILMVLSCAVGFGIYNGLFANAQKDNAVLGVSANITPRILSFQGKLTDSANSPITKEAVILFSLYDSENAPPAAALWQEENTVKTDQDGTFFVLLGKTTPIPNNVFSQNSKLFLGIAIGNSPELRPRQELATVPYAGNAETLQGLEPITNTAKVSNVILSLDSSGNLSIGDSKAHVFQAIGGNLILSGKVLSLTTVPGSNSNIEIAPDGIGKIDLSKPIQNSTNNNNLASAVGSVEFDDTVAILATTSAQAALYINQNSTGTLISASTSGTAKFTVENDGTGVFAGDLGVNGGDLTSTATTFNLFDSTVTTLNLGNSGGTTYVKSNLTANKDFTLTSLTSNGGILYTNGSGKVLQVSAGSSSDCLTGGSSPSFTPCSNIFNQANSVGIGTATPLFKLDVQGSQSATAAAQIFNTDTGTDADGLVLKLGNTSTSAVASSNHFLNFETAGIGIVGSVQGNDGTGVTYATSGIADFAEYFKKDKNQIIEYGSVVCLNDNGLAVKCDPSAGSGQGKIIGVASERPAFLGGKNLGDGSIAVGLIGQVEVFVTNLNGEIKAGDMLTTSAISGIAVKAAKAGQIIGKALEDSGTIDESEIVGFYDPDNKEYRSKAGFPDVPLKPNIIRVAKIYALVNVSWYDPQAHLAQNGDLEIVSSSKYQVSGIENKALNDSPILNTYYLIHNTSRELIERVGAFTELMAANLRAGLIEASEIVAQSLIITSDSIIVNGQNLKDYIVQTIDESNIVSPVVSTKKLAADVISPLSDDSNISISLRDSSFTIQNASGSAVAKIDDQGNASFSGQLSASSGQFGDASISGVLRAKSIVADSITGLEATISNIYSSNFADLASYSAQLSYVPDLTAERAQFNQGLMVFGSTSLSDLSIAERLSIGGTMFVTENSIETLGTNLSLQGLRQGGLSIMGGLVYVDTEGNIKTQGNLSVSGKLAVNNTEGISVLSVNQAGDVIASGSATFSKLNFSLIAPVLAVSATEVIASSSAGIANIAPYQSEITIKNALVTNKSVIYITPAGTPSAQTPFLMRQVPDGFTVGVQSPTNRPIDFNWLIVN